MKKYKTITCTSVFGLVALGLLTLFLSRTAAETGHHSSQDPKVDSKQIAKENAPVALRQIHSEQLPMALRAIDEAVKSVKAGNKMAALKELERSKNILIDAHQTLGKYLGPLYANDRCPIMGTSIKPEKVPETLIREYKGEKIAFCCAECPPAWDKLSDDDKTAKLKEVKIKVKAAVDDPKHHSEHKH